MILLFFIQLYFFANMFLAGALFCNDIYTEYYNSRKLLLFLHICLIGVFGIFIVLWVGCVKDWFNSTKLVKHLKKWK